MNIKKAQHNQNSRRAFTLVEMLVSVTLVLLMMTMFAQVFKIATDSVQKQQIIGENDQKARSMVNLIRGDFSKVTQRYALPFYPNEDLDLGPKSPDLREGYLYISTNDPASFSDDMIQFTVRASLIDRSSDQQAYYGAATPLIDRENSQTMPDLYLDPNQPEVDDGSLSADFAASSPSAQISYFVRNGNLYRRVILIRSPLEVAGGNLDAQPTSGVGNNLLAGLDGSGTYDGAFAISTGGAMTVQNDFHRFFDFGAVAVLPVPAQHVRFIGVEGLSNKTGSSSAAAVALGIPANRFGFNQINGLSREHDGAGLNFIGRFLHAETSSANFNWPMNVMVAEGSDETDVAAQIFGTGNPYSLTGCPMFLPPGIDLVTQLDNQAVGVGGAGGPRRMEDLLLANVHGLKVEIWDERIQRFVSPGYGSLGDPDAAVGDFHIRRNLQADTVAATFNYGPLAPYPSANASDLLKQPHVFDTWHPQVTADLDGDGTVEMSEIQAPYTPYVIYPPQQSDLEVGPVPSIAPPSALSAADAGLNLRGYWRQNETYAPGDVVFARNAVGITGWDFDGDGEFNWLADSNIIPDQGFQVAYRCVRAGEAGPLPPVWSPNPRVRSTETGITSGADPAVWESFDNRRPLKAIRLTISFINDKSDQPRQVSIVLPLTDGV